MDRALTAFIFLTLLTLALFEKKSQRHFSLLLAGAIIGIGVGFLSAAIRAFLIVLIDQYIELVELLRSGLIAAIFEETFRYGAMVLFARSNKKTEGLQIVGGAMGFGAGIIEYVLAVFAQQANASVELFTAVPILMLIGAAMGFALNVARARQNRLSYWLALVAPLVVHVLFNFLGMLVMARVDTFFSFVVVSFVGIGMSAILMTTMRRYWKRYA